MMNVTTGASRNQVLRPARFATLLLALLAAGAGFADEHGHGHDRDGWHSAWTVSHGARQLAARLTLSGQPGLALGPGPGLTSGPDSGAYSDPVRFKVKAFQRLAVSLEVASASDVSAHALGLVTNYYAPGGHAASTGADGFAPVPDNGGNFPV